MKTTTIDNVDEKSIREQRVSPTSEDSPDQSHEKFDSKVDPDDKLWNEYLELADKFDDRLFENWQKILDSVLTFVALFISVLTAYIIDKSNDMNNPAVTTNYLLGQIYTQLNGSLPNVKLDLPRAVYKTQDVVASFLLYISLSLSIVVALVASMAKLWIIRYDNVVKAHAGPYKRAMNRHHAYSGLHSWKLWEILEALWVMVILAVILFGIYVYLAIKNQIPALSYVVAGILGFGFIFLIVTSSSGAFISDSPFKTSISELINFFYRIFPPHKNLTGNESPSTIYLRASSIFVTSICIAALAGFLIRFADSSLPLILLCIPLSSVFSMASQSMTIQSEEAKKKVMSKPRLFTLPLVSLLLGIVFCALLSISMYLSKAKDNRPGHFVGAFIGTIAVLIIWGFCGMKLSCDVPQTVDTDAVSWLLKESGTNDPKKFKKAVETTCQSHMQKEFLLKHLLHQLAPLITSLDDEREKYEGDHQNSLFNDLRGYLACLRHLCDYKAEENSHFLTQLYKNEAALRPAKWHLPEGLVESLKLWRKSTCGCCKEGTMGISRQAKLVLEVASLAESKGYSSEVC